ncbi:hypothetical protein EJB05_30355, partial [Eragrostis curvula]
MASTAGYDLRLLLGVEVKLVQGPSHTGHVCAAQRRSRRCAVELESIEVFVHPSFRRRVSSPAVQIPLPVQLLLCVHKLHSGRRVRQAARPCSLYRIHATKSAASVGIPKEKKA